MTRSIELYFAATPNGRKISIMLEEIGAPYHTYFIDIGRGDQFDSEFLKISPNNKIPAIVDPDGPDGAPISIFESGAILKYLAIKYGKLYPTDMRKQVKVDEWLFWQVGGFGPMLGQNHHFALYAQEKIPYAIKRYQDETHRLYRVLNTQLTGRDYVADEYSIADIAIFDWSNGWRRQGIDIEEFPAVAAWQQRLHARPAVQRGLALRAPAPGRDLAKDLEAQKVLFNQR